MLTFLRKIRRSLIKSGSARKYLLYAVGEILLVVIGILIALQINNWNQQNKRDDLEISLLQEMRNNLSHDLDDIRYNIWEDTQTLNSNKVILYFLENALPFHDSLSTHFYNLPRASTLVANISSYENLKTIGFNLISNDSLRSKITNLYAARYDYIEGVHTRVSHQITWEHLAPILLANIHTLPGKEKAYPLDYNLLVRNNTFKEVLRWHIQIKEFVINLNEETEKEILQILQMINSHIDP